MLKKLLSFSNEHKKIEGDLLNTINESLDEVRLKKIDITSEEGYLNKNFFSILFLGLYDFLNIPPERRKLYGEINFSIRGIVTFSDNLLDEEEKELFIMEGLADRARKFRSILSILIFKDYMGGILRKYLKDDDRLYTIEKYILNELALIGISEADDEMGLNFFLKPGEVISRIHSLRGGRLMGLAFIVPKVLEGNNILEITSIEEDIHDIGIGLQVLDDICDFHKDLKEKRCNYLVSLIYHNGNWEEKKCLHLINGESGIGLEELTFLFPDSLKKAVDYALGYVSQGFGKLADKGFWIYRKDIPELVALLFKLRGLESLLEFAKAYKDNILTPVS